MGPAFVVSTACTATAKAFASAARMASLPLAPRPARADFFDDARQTFQTDIPNFFTRDVPHFFQDDIPCAIVGHPTRGQTKTRDSKPASNKSGAASAPPGEKPNRTAHRQMVNRDFGTKLLA